MSTSADWYAKRLGQAPAPPAAGTFAVPVDIYGRPLAQPLPGQHPGHTHLAQQAPVGTPGLPQAASGPEQFVTYNADTGAQMADDGHVAMLYNSAAMTGGRQIVKDATSDNCPGCGSSNYFKREYGENGIRMRTPASPICENCGLSVMSQGTGRSSKPAGVIVQDAGAHRARQLPRTHQVTVYEGSKSYTFDSPTAPRHR